MIKSVIKNIIRGFIFFIGIVLLSWETVFKNMINVSSSNDSTSIGIIGGADGPTEIYVASSFGENLLPLIGSFLILGVILSIVLSAIKKSKSR